MKKIIVTGGHGQVAYELIQLLKQNQYEYFAPAKEELDITKPIAIDELFKRFKPDAVINAAAYTKVDLAQTEAQLAYAVNAEGPKNLAIACAKRRCPLVHLSTDYVFDGVQTTPYVENSPIIPVNIYGESKRSGEVAVEAHCDHHMILRVSGVFGVHGHNFVKTMLRLAKERETLRVVSDQYICPTPAKAIAETILRMLENPQWGVYHYCGDEVTNWHAFTKDIVQIATQLQYPMAVKNIEPITTADYPTPAKRPSYSVLNCQKIVKTFGINQPSWKEGLSDVISQII